jgi:predicted nucleic acid-binding protein
MDRRGTAVVFETCFIDSSALVKCYLEERGTTWVNELVSSPRTNFYIAHLTGVEVAAAIARRVPARQARTLINEFRTDFTTDFAVIRITDDLIEHAMTLAVKHKLRGYDAVQLAAGMVVLESVSTGDVTFVASNAELLKAAQAEGFLIADPNNYP